MEDGKISDHASCFLIKDERLKRYKNSMQIYEYLIQEGFVAQKGRLFPEGIDWLYVNIYSKVFAKGKIGIALTKVVGDHAVTFDEFVVIYNIYKKYERMNVLQMVQNES